MAGIGIDHVNIKVRDLEASRRFYELVGFRQSGHREGMLFFTLGGHHHHLGLYQVAPDAPGAAKEAVGMLHFCVNVEAEAELGALARKVEAAGYRVLTTVDHVVSKSVYLRDPDGNVLELAYNLPTAEWEHLENPLATDRPYSLPGEEAAD